MHIINLKRSQGSELKKAASRRKDYDTNNFELYQSHNSQRNGAALDDSRNKSSWSSWLDRVNDT